MSLFADGRYQWRETYFVLFDRKHQPTAAEAVKAIGELSKVQVVDTQAGEAGLLESMTVISHVDASGMDITLVTGEEVKEQLLELKKDWKGQCFAPDEQAKIERALTANARYDIYHFEEVGDTFGEDEEALDPATLLLVLSRLAKLCHGVGVDPQAGAVV